MLIIIILLIIIISHRLCVCWIFYFDCDGEGEHFKPVETKDREKAGRQAGRQAGSIIW
jgi:hypothetical protein